MVKNDLQEQPEIVSEDFLKNYIDEEKLRDSLATGVEEEIRENPDSYGWEPEMVEERVYNEELEEEMGEDTHINRDLLVPPKEEEEDEPSEDWIEEKAKEILKDPLEYLKELHGRDEYIKIALNLAPIDYDKAAHDIVRNDGAANTVARDDGTIYDLPNGGVYWKI